MHSFFGGDAVNVNTTTTKQLQEGCHTNSNPNDFSVYWHPTLYAINGEERIPVEARYFKPYYINIHTAEIPLPENFQVISGNAKATSQEEVEELSGISWFCEYGPSSEGDAAAFPTQGCNNGRLQSLLLFHDCVNEETLESAYSGRHNLHNMNRCPDGMKRVPQLRFSVRFDTSGALPNGWSGEAPLELASGPSYSWHGDFINGWLEEAAENMMLATDKNVWQPVDGPLTEAPACVAEDSDPENGTDDYEKSLGFLNKTREEVAEAPEHVAETPTEAMTSVASKNIVDTATSAATPTSTAEAPGVEPKEPESKEGTRHKRRSAHARRHKASL